MNPQLAATIVAVFVLAIFILELRRTPRPSAALWVPFFWFAILSSRPLAVWLDPTIGGWAGASLASTVEDGSPVDRLVLSGLIALSAAILIKRRPQWPAWLRANGAIVAFFVFCAVSVIWSDAPAVALKRWIRAFGTILTILVVVSEADPFGATVALVRRVAYLLIPWSLVLSKYFPALGVGYYKWTGTEFFVGVTTDKNALGRLCAISALFLIWDLASAGKRGTRWSLHSYATATVLAISLWLLIASNSATSLAVFGVGVAILGSLSLPIIRANTQRLGSFVVAAAMVMLVAAPVVSNVLETVVAGLGRNMTFTDRTYIWESLLDVGTNRVVGTGYDSFWLGDRRERFIEEHDVDEAHNGYLEVYLELGAIGVGLLCLIVLSAFRTAKASLLSDFDYGRLRLAVLSMFLVYNITESAYKPTTSMAFTLLLVTLQAPRRTEISKVVPRAVPRSRVLPRQSFAQRRVAPMGARHL
jgi:O-antigen ligase